MSDQRPKPIQMGYDLEIFRKQARGVATSFRRALNLGKITVKREPFEGEATLADVVSSIRELMNCVDRNTVYTALPALHSSDEMVRVGFMADQVTAALRGGSTADQPKSLEEPSDDSKSEDTLEGGDEADTATIPF